MWKKWFIAALFLILFLELCARGQAASQAPSAHLYGSAGPCQVQTHEDEWFDQKRSRLVPVKIYRPADAPGPWPVIIFSHGLGGSRAGYEYLGRHWASHGFVSVHLQHQGSDIDVWRNDSSPVKALRQAALNPEAIVNPPLDLSFALDQLERLAREDSLFQDRLDLDRIGAAGHSFGAYTALTVAGQVMIGPAGSEYSWSDPRIKAFIAMSAPVPQRQEQWPRAYSRIKIPSPHLTGDEDDLPIGDSPAAERRVPYDHITGPDQYLIIFRGGDHLLFAGLEQRAEKDAVFKKLIQMSSTAFWRTYLNGDVQAGNWLAPGGFQAVLGAVGTFEHK